MKIWAKTLIAQKIALDAVQEFPARPSDAAGWNQVLTEICHTMDLARPVVLQKHVAEFRKFSRAVFYPQDFMESVDFDRFEVELFPEKKKQTARGYDDYA